MTNDEICNREAGREMDTSIAEVMGWTHVGPTFCGYPLDFADERRAYEFPARLGAKPVPAYSTDIAAAWSVLEWLRQRFFSVQILVWDHTDKVIVSCHPRRGHYENPPDLVAEAPTAPLALCRAALLMANKEMEH